MSEIQIGDLAPEFTLPTDGGGKIELSDFRGKTVILYFYPKDSTPGCTTQAKAFSDAKSEFESLNAIVIGISKDSVKRHDNFKAKQGLVIILASDEEGQVVEGYGCWILKKLYGREYMGIERATFLIDPVGKIAKIWHKVRVKGHVDLVLDTLRNNA
jgi:peroxiredoxin Q/BCP